jgi:hypothetical protein
LLANINEDLPNSWECPRCVKTGSKTNNKYSKSKSNSSSNTWTPVKKESVGCGDSDGPPDKKVRLSAEDSPPSTDDEDDDNRHQNPIHNNSHINHTKDEMGDDTDTSSSSSQSTQKPYSLLASSSSAHVRSCARFPLLSKGLKQMMPSLANQSSLVNKSSQFVANNNNSNKPEVKGLAALMNCKKKGTSRDRLFKSLKSLKKSSDTTRLSSNSSGVAKKLNKSNGSSITTSSTTTQSSCSSNSNSSVSSPSCALSRSISPSGSQSMSAQNSFSSIKLEMNDSKRDINDESTDDEEVQPTVQQINGNKHPNGNSFTQVSQPIPHREIIKPKYVVSIYKINKFVYF